MASETATPAPRRSRLLVFYGFLAVMVIVVSVVVIAAGQDREHQPPIAGGYDVIGANSCLGPKFDLKQSGRFVNLDNADESLSGRLEFEDGRLTGDVDCVEGGQARDRRRSSRR